MSEGNAPSASFTEQHRPTENDINLLIDIVRRAEAGINAGENLHNALISTYEAVFQERGLDVRDDRACLWVVLKLINPHNHEGTLFERFEQIMREEGTELTFEDELSTSSAFDTQGVMEASVGAAAEPDARGNLSDDRSAAAGPDEWLDKTPPYFAEMMRKAEEIERRNALAYCRGLLRPFRDVQALLQVGDRHYDRKLKSKTISHWSNLTVERQTDYVLAEQHDNHKLRSWSITKMHDQARIQQISAMDEQRLKGRGLYLMTLATREQRLQQKVDAALKCRYLAKLVVASRELRGRQMAMDNRACDFQVVSDTRARRPIWQVLEGHRAYLQSMRAEADVHFNVKLQKRQLRAWHDQTQHFQHMETQAGDYRDFSLLRRHLTQMQQVKTERHDRRIVLGRWILTRWRKYVKHRKQTKYETGYYQMRRKVKMNSARKFLRLIAGRAEQIQGLEQQATRWSDDQLRRRAHGAVVSMYDTTAQMGELARLADHHAQQQQLQHALEAMKVKTEQIQQMSGKAEQFHEIQIREATSRRLHQLSMKLFEVQQEGQKADAYRARRDREVVRTDLKKLRVAAANRRGEEPLVLPPVTPAQRRAEQMSRLSSTTPMYTPALAPRLLSFTARLRGEPGLTERLTERIVEMDEVDEMDSTLR